MWIVTYKVRHQSFELVVDKSMAQGARCVVREKSCNVRGTWLAGVSLWLAGVSLWLAGISS